MSVVTPFRNDKPHATARVVDVISETRYHMDVQVHHGLSCRVPDVDADVVAGRAESIVKVGLRQIDEFQNSRPLLCRGVELRCDMAAWDHERMARAHWEPIANCNCPGVLGHQPRSRKGAERTSH
jgi:hypothetical protein